MTKDLKSFMKTISTLHMDMAKEAYPNGTDAVCKVCGAIRYMTTADCADALAHGWPKHCGKSMRLVSIKGA